MKRKEFLAGIGCFLLAPKRMAGKKERTFWSGFRHKEGVTVGISSEDSEYDCFITVQKRHGDVRRSPIIELSRRWKQCLKDKDYRATEPDEYTKFAHEDVLRDWILRLAKRYSK